MNRWAIIASVGLHAATALAALTPWRDQTPPVGQPLVVELVISTPAPAVAETPAVTEMPVAPIRSKTSPKARRLPTSKASPTAITPIAPAPSSPDGATGEDAATAAAEPSAAPSGSGAAAIAATPPGYTLGDAHTPEPEYPWSARRRGVEGRVVLRLEVDAQGRPTSVELAQSSGDATLDRAAITTLWHWRLRPAMAGGMAVAGHVLVPIRFELT